MVDEINRKDVEFKTLLSNSYRNYLYDVSFNEFSDDFNTDAEGMKIRDYIFNNSNISLLCKSIGQIENEIQDVETEILGRKMKTGGKYIVKSPITIQFYDTKVEDNMMLSDVFKHWVKRWNMKDEDGKYLFTRRRYIDDNSIKLNIRQFSGNSWNSSTSSMPIERDSKITDVSKSQLKSIESDAVNGTSKIPFDRFNTGLDGVFWKSVNKYNSGELAFINAMRGIGGSGLTWHGIVNSIVFGLYKTLTFTEAFGKFIQESKDINFSDPETWIGVFLNQNQSLNQSFDRTYDDGNSKPTEDILVSRTLNKKLINEFNQLRNSDLSKNIISTTEAILNTNQFVDNKQLQKSLEVLKNLLGTDINSLTISKLAEITGVEDFINENQLDLIKKILTEVNDGLEASSNFINTPELERIKLLLTQLDSYIEIFKTNFPLNEEQQIKIKKLLNEIDDAISGKSDFISRVKYEEYLKNIKPKFNTNHFLDSRELLKKIFTPISAIPRALMIMHNAKSLYNLVHVNNGWDDFINTDKLFKEGGNETLSLSNTTLLTVMMRREYNRIMDDASDALKECIGDYYKTVPGADYESQMFKNTSNYKSQRNELISLDIKMNDLIRTVVLNYAYPSSVVFSQQLGNDKIGDQSIPVFDVQFNFFDIEEN